MKNNYLYHLNDAQYQAVINTNGPILIIAGAGSGKTRVLTYRIAYLLEQGINPFNILALTFTNKSATEMYERILKLVDQSNLKKMLIGTFHSIFSKILRIEGNKLGYTSQYTIYDKQDSERIIKNIIAKMQLNQDLYKYKTISNIISYYKNNMLFQHTNFPILKSINQDKIKEIYKSYILYCFHTNAMDFDDILLKTHELFIKYPTIKIKYQDKFKYILVDEYQDINLSQYNIIKMLSYKTHNICVVGDDSQSIYAFRGANINNILNFEKDYSNAKIIRLEQNYRSTYHIVQAANNVISNNKNKIEKNIWTNNELGEKIQIYHASSDYNEALFVANKILEIKQKNLFINNDFAILYRKNSQSRVIEEIFLKKQISFRIYGSISFYQRKEIKNLIAYFKLIINPKDEDALLRIINYPKRGIGENTIKKIKLAASYYQTTIYEILKNITIYSKYIALSENIISKLNNFMSILLSFNLDKDHNAFIIADKLMNKLGLHNNDNLKKEEYENLKEFLTSIQHYVLHQKNGDTSLQSFLEYIFLSIDSSKLYTQNLDNVSLMTIHSSKGLEFPIIFIIGLEENILPSNLQLDSALSLEEERRLFYVALTRAKKQVFISHVKNRYYGNHVFNNKPSRFINEINTELINYISTYEKNNKQIIISSQQDKSLKNIKNLKIKNIELINKQIDLIYKGTKISHNKFGIGTVIDIQGNDINKIASIDFQKLGKKKIYLRISNFKIIC